MFHVRASHHFEWLRDRLGSHFHLSPDCRAIEAVNEKTGQIVGMVAYDGWTENSALVHIALDTPIAWRALCRPAFSYPFEEAGRGLLIANIASTNTRSLGLTAHVGFRQTHRIRDGIAKGIDFVLFEMRREECRWLED